MEFPLNHELNLPFKKFYHESKMHKEQKLKQVEIENQILSR